jgi:uncharacterized phage protein gp47/JayE
MATGTPSTSAQVEARIKADVQREAPDSNPYLRVHWLRSLIAGVARRIFDFYGDLRRTEDRLMPDTADDEIAPRWGNIYVGPKNVESAASGLMAMTGNVGGAVPLTTVLTAGGNEYVVNQNGVITAQSLNVLSITRSGTTAVVTTAVNHNLSSFVPVTISGADQAEYNAVDAAITVTGLDTFEYEVSGTPATPATGTILADFTAGVVGVESSDFGSAVNLDADTAATLQSPIVDVDDTFYVTFGAIGGGTDEESTINYRTRYLEKIRNPVAHFNPADIEAKAKEVAGVTRVFVEKAGTVVGSIAVTSITRNANVATVVTASPHGYDDGQLVAILGANQAEYNVTDTRIIVEDASTFHFVVLGTPATPATGTITASATIPLGQVRTFFMRDNDTDPIPSASEVQAVKDALDEILPATTATADNIVSAPTAVVVDYTFTDLQPDTPTMRTAIEANIAQFHAEQTAVGVSVDEDAYRAAIKNTVDPENGDTVDTFTLSGPVGDIPVASGEIATKGAVNF